MTALDFRSTPTRTGPTEAPPVLDTPEARDQLECPLCRYSLRGLGAGQAEPRCPECGYRFSWHELLRARQYRHPYLFEHHGRPRSFVRTLVAGLSPRRFWSSLNAGHAIHAPRLAAYALVSSLMVALTASAGLFAAKALTTYQQDKLLSWRTTATRRPYVTPTFDVIFRDAADTLRDPTGLYRLLLLVCLLWPWATLAVLLVFQTSMRRARIRPGHVVRCVVYSGDAFAWTWAVILIADAMKWTGLIRRAPYYPSGVSPTLEPAEAWPAVGCVVVVLALATYRLGTGYRHYLRFDHAWGTVLASQVIFLLAVVTALSLFYAQFHRFFT
jgi:hypothetical protein